MSQENAELAQKAIQFTCITLAERGCTTIEVIQGLTTMLAYSLAAVDCCEEHSAETEALTLLSLRNDLERFRVDRARWVREQEGTG